MECFSLLALVVHVFYKAFMIYAFLLLYLISAVLVLLFLVFKNFVLLSALLTSHTGASWIDHIVFQAFPLLLLPPNPIKLVLFKAIAEGTNFKV